MLVFVEKSMDSVLRARAAVDKKKPPGVRAAGREMETRGLSLD
jgi:hypothetical protein